MHFRSLEGLPSPRNPLKADQSEAVAVHLLDETSSTLSEIGAKSGLNRRGRQNRSKLDRHDLGSKALEHGHERCKLLLA